MSKRYPCNTDNSAESCAESSSSPVRRKGSGLVFLAVVVGVSLGAAASVLYINPDMAEMARTAWWSIRRGIAAGDMSGVEAAAPEVAPAKTATPSSRKSSAGKSAPRSVRPTRPVERPGVEPIQAASPSVKPGASGTRVVNLPPFESESGAVPRNLDGASPAYSSAPGVINLPPFGAGPGMVREGAPVPSSSGSSNP
ncbi:MAG TPA: hypothetical protein VFY29_06030 [Terriglobia bacterium]|nr:hypothetical protein [Terriglobia bacterium]